MLRKANVTDKYITYNWVNDSLIRKYSYSKTKVLFEDHYTWFKNKLESNDSEYYILEINNLPIGSIRFDELSTNKGKINYLIDSSHTGKGMGSIILNEGILMIEKNHSELESVYGLVFKENIASIKIFKKLGFKEEIFSESELIFKKNTNENRKL